MEQEKVYCTKDPSEINEMPKKEQLKSGLESAIDHVAVNLDKIATNLKRYLPNIETSVPEYQAALQAIRNYKLKLIELIDKADI